MDKILVIGGAGYIGSHVTLALCDKGYDVTIFDNMSTGHKENLDNRATFVKGDILNFMDIKTIFSKKYEAIFHFAALKAAGKSMESPEKYAETNIIGTINILNQMIKTNIKYFIFSSTAAVYGIPEYLPLDEDHPTNPINFYGFTKLEIERILNWYSKLKGIKFAALRYFNAAGYNFEGKIKGLEKNSTNLLPIVLETASGIRDNVQVYGNDHNTPDGTGVRDYIHVTDLAEAHVKSLEYLKTNNKNLTINLATGKGYSVLEVINMAERAARRTIPYTIVNKRSGDPAELVAISKSANDLLNWKPQYSDLRKILDTMWNVYI